MTKIANKALIVIASLLMFIPFINLKALTYKTVNDQSELKEAIENEEYDVIELGSNIDTTSKITITRPLTIDGKGHTIKYTGQFKGTSDFKTWDGIYVLQIYKTSVTLKDIKLTGGNAGLLINGGNANFEGTIDVSGNGFGGIELGQGANVETTPKLSIDPNANIVNTTETEGAPTLWADETTGTLEMNGMVEAINDGEELSTEEIDEMFEVQKSPQTSDDVILYMGVFTLSILSLFVAKKINA